LSQSTVDGLLGLSIFPDLVVVGCFILGAVVVGVFVCATFADVAFSVGVTVAFCVDEGLATVV
jgi:hypothetical protein